MISVTVDITKALDAITAAEGLVKQAIGAALYQGAEAVLTESKKIVPVRTGVLRSSGIVYPPEWDGVQWIVQIGYGGAAEDYAWLVHENMASAHAKGKQAKYLSDPFYAMAPKVVAHVQAAVERALA